MSPNILLGGADVKLEGIRAQERMVNVLAQSRTPVTIIFGVSPDIAVPAATPSQQH
jgi:hypothetical protein